MEYNISLTNTTNSSILQNVFPPAFKLDPIEDVGWLLLCACIILTMQIGFGLLEAGFIHPKNQVNILMKNIMDLVLGGTMYWLFGYGLSFGSAKGTNPFVAFGDNMFDPSLAKPTMTDHSHAEFFFQLSYSTTAV